MKLYKESEIALEEAAKRLELDFTENSNFALGWRMCYEFINEISKN